MSFDHPRECRLFGFYRGMVLKHLPHGNCKIYIPGVYDNSLSAVDNWKLLPDAQPAAPLFCGNNFYNGVFSYPNLSSIVWCFFQNADANYPVYFAATQGGISAESEYDHVKHLSATESQRDYEEFVHGEEDVSNRHVLNVQNETNKTYVVYDEDGNIDTHLLYNDGQLCSHINTFLCEEEPASIETYITTSNNRVKSQYADINTVIPEQADEIITQITKTQKNEVLIKTNETEACHSNLQESSNSSNNLTSTASKQNAVYCLDQKGGNSSNKITVSSEGSTAIINIENNGSNSCKIVIKSDGTISITAGKSVTVDTKSVTVNASNSYTVNTSSYTVNAPSISLNGNTNNSGTMKIGGVTTFSPGFTFEGHIHMGDGGPIPAPTSNPIG